MGGEQEKCLGRQLAALCATSPHGARRERGQHWARCLANEPTCLPTVQAKSTGPRVLSVGRGRGRRPVQRTPQTTSSHPGPGSKKSLGSAKASAKKTTPAAKPAAKPASQKSARASSNTSSVRVRFPAHLGFPEAWLPVRPALGLAVRQRPDSLRIAHRLCASGADRNGNGSQHLPLGRQKVPLLAKTPPRKPQNPSKLRKGASAKEARMMTMTMKSVLSISAQSATSRGGRRR